jgi:surfactin family lipopeptide synthetase A
MAVENSAEKQSRLERYLRNQREVRRTLPTIPRRPPDQPIPATFAQEQIWLHAQLVPDLPLYNEPVTIHHHGPLDAAILERSFNEILRRHEAWSTCFEMVEGQLVQEVKPNLSISLPVTDLRNLPPDQRNAAALMIATQDARKPLDFGRAPLFRARLLRLDEEEYRLYLALSHIIFDGVAIYRVFLPELCTLYKAYAAGEESPLPELPLQYPDFAFWQRQTIHPDRLSQHITYWKRQLTPELPVLDLPLDHPRPPVQTFRGSMYPFVLSGSLTAALKRLSGHEGVTLFQTLLAGLAALLCRYSGQDDIPIGSVTAGRDRPELNALLGYFLNIVVLRADLSADPSFRELLKRSRNVALEALEHDCVPWGLLIQELTPPRDRSRNPFFQVLFSLEPPMPDVDSNWRLTQMDVDTGATKYDLYLELDERHEGVLARFHYSTDLFDPATIVRMANHWMKLLEAAASNPELRVSQLPLLSESEKHLLLVEWNETQSESPLESSRTEHQTAPGDSRAETCIHALFETQARRSPDAVAVVAGNLQLTYRELNQRANQLAWYLLKRGVGPEVHVGLCVDRRLGMVIALLGILKAGAAYVPLDPRVPDDRMSFILSDAKPRIVLTEEKLKRDVFGKDSILLDSDWKVIAEESKENPDKKLSPQALAYVMYTSGSTGKPKGVPIEHGSVVNLLRSMRREPGLTCDDVLLAVTTLSFDIAGLEIYLPLISGARLVIASSEDVVDGNRLRDLLNENRVTFMQATPATWRLLLEAGWQGSPDLKILCGGEALPPELARELTVRAGSVWNVYGPTETTIWSTAYRVTGREEASIPIGRPIANTSIYILDPAHNPVPINVTGEIYIGGDGLARGYLNRPELTAERFVANPLAPHRSARLYRTGDLGCYKANGDIEYAGRVDSQVKLRGMRLELGEIEAVLESHPEVREAVVALTAEQQRLAAFLRMESGNGQGPSSGELRRFVRARLPDQMVPASYSRLEQWPLLPSGKVDRQAVLRTAAVPLTDDGLAAPRTEVERKLAAVWQELLELEQVGVEQNFFELGGHSLLAMQVMARIRSQFEVELPVRSLFEEPTLAALATAVEKAQAQGLKTRTPILQRRSRPTATPAPSPEALLAELDNLSATELQNLLQRVRRKPPT